MNFLENQGPRRKPPLERVLRKALLYASVAACVFLIAFQIGQTVGPRLRAGAPVNSDSQPDTGPQLVFVYVGRAACGWCQRPETKLIVAEAVRSLRARADSTGLVFSAVGVGLDSQPTASLDHLREIADFDQLLVGGGWGSEAALRFVWGEFGGSSGTPQVLLIGRNLARSGQMTSYFTATQEQVLARYVGLYELMDWAESAYGADFSLITGGQKP